VNIYIFGLGAIGSNVLIQLIRKYPNIHFIGIDYDIVEERNIATQVYMQGMVGIPKASAIISAIASKLYNFKYSPVIKRVETGDDVENILSANRDTSLILDCFDNSHSRKILYKLRENTLHIGFSPKYSAEILWNENYSVPGDIPDDLNDICIMTEAIPFINLVASLACFIISEFIDENIKRNILITNKYVVRVL